MATHGVVGHGAFKASPGWNIRGNTRGVWSFFQQCCANCFHCHVIEINFIQINAAWTEQTVFCVPSERWVFIWVCKWRCFYTLRTELPDEWPKMMSWVNISVCVCVCVLSVCVTETALFMKSHICSVWSRPFAADGMWEFRSSSSLVDLTIENRWPALQWRP